MTEVWATVTGVVVHPRLIDEVDCHGRHQYPTVAPCCRIHGGELSPLRCHRSRHRSTAEFQLAQSMLPSAREWPPVARTAPLPHGGAE
jgi:hypothetical protein